MRLNFSKKIAKEFNITLNNTDLKMIGWSKQKNNATVLEENKNEILFNGSSAYPQNLLIIFQIYRKLCKPTKNLAVDQFSVENVRNRDIISIVEDEKGEIMDNKPFTPEKQIIDNLDIRRKMKEIKEYMYKKMDEKKSQSILYLMQGLSMKKYQNFWR